MPFFCGVGAGILSAWGVGGGTLLLLVMTLLLGLPQRMAQGINLLFFLPTAAVALCYHRKNGLLDAPTLRQAIPWGVCFAALGALLATAVEVSALRRPFGLFLLIAGLSLLWQSRGK
ncbi:MAG: TSUP family transporter [Oscillospiraceae bacterium]